MQIPVVRNVLEANENMAAHVRRQLSGRKILTLNLISSPGAGKPLSWSALCATWPGNSAWRSLRATCRPTTTPAG